MTASQRLAVIDGGEATTRVLDAVTELNREGFGPPITTVAVHTEADAAARCVRDADEAVCIGPATYVDPRDGERRSAYLDTSRLLTALHEANVDLVWPGRVVNAGDPEFAVRCEKEGIRVLGPGSELTRALAELVAHDAERLTGLPVAAPDEAHGRGVRRLEAQVATDGTGTVWVLGVRDCSVRRGAHQVLEESAPAGADPGVATQVAEAGTRLCAAAGQRGTASLTFLYDGRGLSLAPVPPERQVDHPVTELTTGVDLVKLELYLGRGGRLPIDPPAEHGYAVQALLCAEDAAAAFAPTPGTVTYFRPPAGTGVRVDTTIAEGEQVSTELRTTVAKVSAWGRDRNEALSRLRRGLLQTLVVVAGGTTTKGFLLATLDRPELARAAVDDGWLDRLVAAGEHLPAPQAPALLQAAVEAYDVDHAADVDAFLGSAARGRPEVPQASGHQVELVLAGQAYPVRVFRTGPGAYRIATGEGVVDVGVERLSRYERRLSYDGHHFRTVVDVQGLRYAVEVDGVPHRMTRQDGGYVRSPSPAFVVALLVRPGDEVDAGTPLAVLESMKMESTVTAPYPGRVKSLAVSANVQVNAGAPLVQLQPLTNGPGEAPLAATTDLLASVVTTPASGEPARCARVFESLRSYLLGYDLDPASLRSVLEEQGRLCRTLPVCDADLAAHEFELLDVFADVAALSMPQPRLIDSAQAGRARSAREYLLTYLAWLDPQRSGVPETFQRRLRRALSRYGVDGLERTPQLEHALLWMYRSFVRLAELAPAVTAVLDRRLTHQRELAAGTDEDFHPLVERFVDATQGRFPLAADLAREVRFRYFEEPLLDRAQDAAYAEMDRVLDALAVDPHAAEREAWVQQLVWCPHPMRARLRDRYRGTDDREFREALVEARTRRFYRIRDLRDLACAEVDGRLLCTGDYSHDGHDVRLVTAYAALEDLPAVASAVARRAAGLPPDQWLVVDLATWRSGESLHIDALAEQVRTLAEAADFGAPLHRLDVSVTTDGEGPEHTRTQHVTFRQRDGALVEEALYRNLHPMIGKRLRLWRLENFDIERLASAEDVYLFRGVARSNPKDERLFAMAEVRDLTPVLNPAGRVVALPHAERMVAEAAAAMRAALSGWTLKDRPLRNRIDLYVRPVFALPPDVWRDLAHRMVPMTVGLGLEKVTARVQLPDGEPPATRDALIEVETVAEQGVTVRVCPIVNVPIRPLTEYHQRVLRAQRAGAPYPYELVRMLTPERGMPSDFPAGSFVEHDLDEHGRLVPVSRPYGENTAAIVAGVVTNHTDKVPEGMRRVALLGDPTKGLGNLAEAECRRIIAGLDLAEQMQVPLEWFALSSGARIAMDSGTENMDWIAAVLRRLIEFTQHGGEVNVVVTGINVGAQPYWNAEATMLMHTRGILVMTPESAMVLTGKTALDFSGGVSADDNFGIGGFETVMGPNGQGQYWAPTLQDACALLFRHYDHTYVVPGEGFPRRAHTHDPVDRDVRDAPHGTLEGTDFATVGDVFSERRNPERKKAFDVRSVMRAVTDQDHEPLERWSRWRDAESAVVWDAHIGGVPVCLIGLESRTVVRTGFVPGDGPPAWTSGTLFPQSSRKVARAVNAASGNRPLVVLANLSGFDGSPESMRKWQLEYGAEIGRAVTNFRGPIVFVVVSRYHGGAFVVFSKRLNEQMEIAAVEGSYASVIGGAPAAAVVFAREVSSRTDSDPRVTELRDAIASRAGDALADLQAHLARTVESVRAEKLREVADEFDAVHSVQRALRVGSVDRIIPAAELRPYVVDALERGLAATRR